jgi:hypothetical protein
MPLFGGAYIHTKAVLVLFRGNNVLNMQTCGFEQMFEVFGSQRKEMLLQTKLDIGMVRSMCCICL